MRKCSQSLAIREIQIKPHYDITLLQLEWQKLTRQETTIVGEDVEKGDPSSIVGGNASWCSHFGKQYGDSSKS